MKVKYLKPIRLLEQIGDALGAYKESPEGIAGYNRDMDNIKKKIAYLESHASNIVTINGTHAINPKVKGINIYYSIFKENKYMRCFYPIQYATIRFNTWIIFEKDQPISPAWIIGTGID